MDNLLAALNIVIVDKFPGFGHINSVMNRSFTVKAIAYAAKRVAGVFLKGNPQR
ncbi:hypothetical protein [Erwinia sp. SLM-02]|uniref:hypothetical protein n=1 Tax=Erwinia sp. SLM-02 TaxID=3020057 RepID=UPI003080E459